MLQLDGKVAIITGGTSGIGAKTAELFVTEGARVVIAGRREERGRALVEEFGRAARFMRTDVTEEEDIRRLAEYAVEEFGRIDCLVNNAGSIPTGATVLKLDLEGFDEAIRVHVRSALAGIKHVGPVMVRQNTGCIINMGSIVGLQAGIGSIAYSTAKAAVLHMTKCAAIELGEYGVRVNSISPGPVVTGIFAKTTGQDSDAADLAASKVRDAFREILPQVQPLSRAGTAEDVAQAALFFASDESSFVTGHDLVVDGGTMAGRPAAVMRSHREVYAKVLS